MRYSVDYGRVKGGNTQVYIVLSVNIALCGMMVSQHVSSFSSCSSPPKTILYDSMSCQTESQHSCDDVGTDNDWQQKEAPPEMNLHM